MLRFFILISILTCFGITKAQSDDRNGEFCVYGFTGTYQGVNVYVQNPLDINGIGFAVKSVTVNGVQVSEQVFGSAFMIDLSKHSLNIGDSVAVRFYHNSFETPRIVNTEALTPIANADVEKLWMENDSTLIWCSSNESQKFDYVIEQYRWNKWIKLGEVLSNGTAGENCYSFVPDLHSGENTLRIVQFGINGEKKVSDMLRHTSNKKPLIISTSHVYNDYIEFTDFTMYEIFNSSGQLIKKGYGRKAHLTGLKKGFYYVNFDNTAGNVFDLHYNIDSIEH